MRVEWSCILLTNLLETTGTENIPPLNVFSEGHWKLITMNALRLYSSSSVSSWIVRLTAIMLV